MFDNPLSTTSHQPANEMRVTAGTTFGVISPTITLILYLAWKGIRRLVK